MAETLRVRRSRPADAQAVCALHETSIRAFGPEAYDDEQVTAWADGHEPDDYPIDDPECAFFVAQRGDRVVGFGEVRFDQPDYFEAVPDDYGEVRAVYVHPDAAREGVGTALLERLEHTARAAGTAGVGLWSSQNAVGFYGGHGFRRLGERTMEFGDTGVTATVVEMAKSL